MKALTTRNDYHPEMLRRFNGDVDQHEMQILLDEGVYRHLRFKAPDAGMYWFDILTSPGMLTIRADMGTYVFARELDMFDWFGTAYVNAGYWAEKVKAADPNSGIERFDEDIFRRWIIQDFWERRTEYEPEKAKQIWADIRDSIFDDYASRHSAEACHEIVGKFRSYDFQYHDDWEQNWNGYSAQFLWCCHAIIAGIRDYREATR